MYDRIITAMLSEKTELMSQVNELFRDKVQYEELVRDINDRIQHARGKLEGLDKAAQLVNDMKKADEVETILAEKGKGGKDVTESST